MGDETKFRPHSYFCRRYRNCIAAILVTDDGEPHVKGTEREAEVKLICCDEEMELLRRGRKKVHA